MMAVFSDPECNFCYGKGKIKKETSQTEGQAQ